MIRIVFPLIFLVLFSANATAQEGFSVTTDIGLLRNLGKNQKFFALGQTIQGNYHFTPRHSFYGWFVYFIPGKFSNEFSATAKDMGTLPQQINYTVNASWAYREVSFGWKYYLKGNALAQEGWNLYGLAGLGLMFSESINSTSLDTSLYHAAERPVIGEKNFTRLNLDLGLGGEVPLGANFYIYSDLRTWVNTSSYPSAVFHSDKNATFAISLHAGVRLLFDY